MSWLRLNGKILQNEDKLALGSKVSKDVEKNLKEIPSITASTLLRKVLEKDRQRVSDAVTFFFDYLKTLQEMYRVLKPGSYCCIVIGDQSIRKMLLDLEKVTNGLCITCWFYPYRYCQLSRIVVGVARLMMS